MSFFEQHNVAKAINAAGTMTSIGASRIDGHSMAAMNEIMPEFISMRDLHLAANKTIARVTGAEAGCAVACASSGIVASIAGCMTGANLYHVERLPDTTGLRSEVIVQKGHMVDYGAALDQMIRLPGAKPVEVGTVNGCEPYQLRGAIHENTAAALYVISHHAVQAGMMSLNQFVHVAHEKNIPVIVDGAAESDMKGILESGADLTVHSGHKYLHGPTSGFVAGHKELVRATYMQERGIARCMKIGKESIAGLIAALERWPELDQQKIRAERDRRIEQAANALNHLKGANLSRIPDPTGNPIVRLRLNIDPDPAGLTAREIAKRLSTGSPPIYVRDEYLDLGAFELDPCNLTDEEMKLVTDRICAILANPDEPKARSAHRPVESLWTEWPDR